MRSARRADQHAEERERVIGYYVGLIIVSIVWIAVSPRKIRRQRPSAPSAPLGPERVEAWPDDDWVVRPVPGAAATKSYRCPGCDQEIHPGTPHMVAWPSRVSGVEARRHWHTACWQRRMQRKPGR